MRLLLAEDEKDLSDALVTVLKHNNYSVDAVYNGQDALDYLEAGDYDGAILDIMMPKMDGITVLKKVRADKSRNQKTGGFGIGLSVVYAIVNAHKGKITARSDDGTSLVFTITLSA